MAQPVVQQPTLSPPLSPSAHIISVVPSPVTDFGSKPLTFPHRPPAPASSTSSQTHNNNNNNNSRPTKENGANRSRQSRSRPTSSSGKAHSQHAGATSQNGKANGVANAVHTGATNGHAIGHSHRTHHNGVDAANDPSIANAPGAALSIATKPQDRDPSLLRQPPQSKGFDGISSYQLDHNGRIPASEYNYLQRDKLVASAHRSAISAGNYHWLALMDLSHLASQHHLSPYSVMKFGPRGSPFAYIPITLQQPDVVHTTMMRQRVEERQAKAWLIAKRRRKVAAVHSDDEDLPVLRLPADVFKKPSQPAQSRDASTAPAQLGTKRPASFTTPPDTRARCVLRTDADTDGSELKQVERDLGEAMAESISATAAPEPASSSEEDEVAPVSRSDQVDLSRFDRSTRMAENGSAAPETSRTNGGTQPNAQGNQGANKDTVADELMTSSEAGSNVEVGGPLDKERVMAQEMESVDTTAPKPGHVDERAPAVTDNSSLGPLVHMTGNGSGPASSLAESSSAEQQQQQQQQQPQNQLAMKTSDTHPIHISPILPDELLPEVGRRIRALAEPQLRALRADSAAAGTAATERYFDDHAHEQVHCGRLIRLHHMLDLAAVTATDPSANYLSQSQLAEQAARENTQALNTIPGENDEGSVGNLLLSSCPGKKVRLSGPVRGRGAICRDLGLDLARIHSIGVRAVVCCLNDEELEYLGAPWAEYEREADRLGLDVFRLPMAEGFAPTKVAEMDAAMTAIVTDCTLRGTNVLVHCRGGVGRAGLIACAWLLKMGFVADKPPRPKKKAEEARKFLPHAHELDDKPRKARASEVDDADDDAETILETVRSLIETIRRRRSPKAIETAEQVRFLVDYLTYLHRQERLRAQAGR
ncbi:hypothetical protein L1887_54224 [Cichorium endivia]|nr:hypothetical protein L1887_54224 [Cichorium endivia]